MFCDHHAGVFVIFLCQIVLNIVLDISRALTRLNEGLHPTGVDRVSRAYVERYHETARAIISHRGYTKLLCRRHSKQAFEILLGDTATRSSIRTLVAKSLLAPGGGGMEGSVLLHASHNGMEHVRYHTKMKNCGVRSVFFVHDLIPLTHSEYCRPGVHDTHRRRIHTALNYADGLIVNSDDTLRLLEAEADDAGLPMPPSAVARLAPGIDMPHAPAEKAPIAAPYFVMLGTIEPRKNHYLMLHVWRRLVETLGDAAPKLVIIGRRGWECENVVDLLERSAPLRGAVIEESNCSDSRLRAWLQHARALLFPSFVEGYGMPLVEALMLGIPVIASDLAVFHEIAANIPDYLDPLDGPGWLSRIQSYAAPNGPERATQIARIEHFKAPTWAEHFERVDRFLDSLAR